VDNVHLLLGDAALLAGLVCLGAPKDHEASLDLGELGVLLLGIICWFIGLHSKLLGNLLAKHPMDVAPNDGVVLEEVLRLPLIEWAAGLQRHLEVLRARTLLMVVNIHYKPSTYPTYILNSVMKT